MVGLRSPEEQELGLASVMALAGECDDADKLSRVGAGFRLLMCEKYLELHWLETRAQRHDGVRILGEIVGLRKRWFLYNDDVYYYNSDRLIGAQRRKRKKDSSVRTSVKANAKSVLLSLVAIPCTR